MRSLFLPAVSFSICVAGCGSGSSSSASDASTDGSPPTIDGSAPDGADGGQDVARGADAGMDSTSAADTGGHPLEAGAPGDSGSTSAEAGSDGGDSGTCGSCDAPPDDCHAKVGTCVGGQCSYAFVDGASCDDGNPCTVADTCTTGGCFGTAMVCNTPPAAVCLTSSESETYDAQGSCTGGLCVYASHTTACSSSCVDGTCGTDPCATITCSSPPSVCFKDPGTCSAGSCSYPYNDGASCDDGNACTSGDSCATGVCLGAPIACSSPPSNVCSDASTLKVYGASGTCSAGTCSYSYAYQSCPGGCANAACAATGWTKMNSNTTDNLMGVWGTSATSVWAVGENGTAAFYNGANWEVWPVPAQAEGENFAAIHGSAANDVFAFAGPNLLHFNGAAWSFVTDLTTTQNCNQVSGVFATGDANDDVYASCLSSPGLGAPDVEVLFEIDGQGTVTRLTEFDTQWYCAYDARGLWAFSSTNVWMPGCPPQSWGGTSTTSLGTTGGGTEFWAMSPTSVFSVSLDVVSETGGPVLNHWNGSVWTPINSGYVGMLSSVWGTSDSRVFASAFNESGAGAILYYDGVGVTTQTLPASTPSLLAVWAATTGQVFAVGDNGTILTGP